MREGLREADLRRLAALVRGGTSYEQAVAAEFRDVNPEVLDNFRAHVIELAKEPGEVASLAVPPTPEEEARRTRLWLDSLGRPTAPLKAIRSIGGALGRPTAPVKAIRSIGGPRRR